MGFKQYNKIFPLLKKAGKFSFGDNGDKIFVQWLRNKEGNPPQEFGNQTVYFKLNDDTFENIIGKYKNIDSKFKKIYDLGSAENVKKTLGSDNVYLDMTRVVVGDTQYDWELFSISPELEEILPIQGSRKYALQVESFDSPDVELWGYTADSDIFPLDN